MITLTQGATTKVKEILTQQEPTPAGLRIGVVGGGCSGFSYAMTFESNGNKDELNMDKVFNFDGLKVFVDQASLLYLENTEIDYVESLEGSGFKFSNPNVKNTCGCGSSFSV
jgi:iron-sulfur cluster assembly accessory protein